jgi:hypothetical protein
MSIITDKIIKDLASKAGVTVDLIKRNRHSIVYVSKGENRGVVTISITCNDPRVHKNIIADMKRVVR